MKETKKNITIINQSNISKNIYLSRKIGIFYNYVYRLAACHVLNIYSKNSATLK